MARVLVTGGAGFVGSAIALRLAALGGHEVVALDNLRRRGSELNLPRLADAGVSFRHGDVRELEDVLAVGRVDAIVECSAEPSVLAGVAGDTGYVVGSNLLGAYHCFEAARQHGAQVVFLSTSRVYPYGPLGSIALRETESRFEISDDQVLAGVGPDGVSEAFPLDGPRTLYGATKLSAELLLAEYGAAFGVPWVVDRCGVIAGPWQMGKADQGVFVHWARAHWFGRPLSYIGFGGSGRQVRDLLHVDDLAPLVLEQIESPGDWNGVVANVGGGPAISLSLRETTEICRELTGRTVAVDASSDERPGDVPVYVSDCSHLYALTSWRPRRDAAAILEDIVAWIRDNEDAVSRLPA